MTSCRDINKLTLTLKVACCLFHCVTTSKVENDDHQCVGDYCVWQMYLADGLGKLLQTD